jgi:hypothetical protein
VEHAIYVLDHCQKWLDSLPDKDFEAIAGRIDLLAEQGPATSRPVVDTISGRGTPT